MQGPGTFSNLTVNTVVASAPAGKADGVYVYVAGTTPRLGNLPLAWMSSSAKDPFGNTLPPITVGIENATASEWIGFVVNGSAPQLALQGAANQFAPSLLQTQGSAGLTLTTGTQTLSDTSAFFTLLSAQNSGNVARMNVFALLNAASGLNVQAGATIQSGNVDIQQVGKGLLVAEGANAKQGVATLAAGTVVVSNTTVSANSRIHLTAQDNNSTGALRVSARTAGTSFTITSSNAADTGVVAWEMFEPG